MRRRATKILVRDRVNNTDALGSSSTYGLNMGGSKNTNIHHTPVLLKEVIEALHIKPEGTYIDATLGEGGHSEAILQASAPQGHLLGLDLDPNALRTARKRLQRFWAVATLVRGNSAHIAHLSRIFGFSGVDGILFDLGLSSLQLEGETRGFSFQRSAPLDMRFDPDQELSADDVVNYYSIHDLTQVLEEYGEEPRSRAIARAIAEARPVKDTLELAEIVSRVVRKRRSGIHPATRTFQAIRMEVNGELANLREGLEQSLQVLKTGGRLVVISYHSLEDRIVKEFMRKEARDATPDYGTPASQSGRTATLRLITKKIIRPTDAEVEENPRSRSAKMRIAERI
jgi:16S rRNA (cytosine1402-N4)-methyltransferase